MESVTNFAHLRIALVAPMASETGGMAVQAARLVTHLSAEEIAVVPVPVNGGAVWIKRWPLIRTAYHFLNRLLTIKRIAREIDGVVVFSCDGRYLQLVTYPIVHYCHAKDIPVVVSHRGGDTKRWLRQSSLSRTLLKKSERESSSVHVSSQYLKRIFEEYGIRATAVPIIIETNVRYRPRSGRLRLIVNTRGMGRFHGTSLLVQVFGRLAARNDEVRLVIAGIGPELEMTRKLVTDLHLDDRVHFPGQMSEAAMTELLDAADLMLNTSSFDNTPNAIFEAFAAGVPVITSGPGGIPEMIGDDTRGYLVRDATPEAFVAAIERCIHRPQDTLRKVSDAHQWVQSFSWQQLRQSYLEVFVRPFLTKLTRSSVPMSDTLVRLDGE